jgi:hypothetical protein
MLPTEPVKMSVESGDDTETAGTHAPYWTVQRVGGNHEGGREGVNGRERARDGGCAVYTCTSTCTCICLCIYMRRYIHIFVHTQTCTCACPKLKLLCSRQIENTAAWGASLMDEDDEDDAADTKEPAPTGTNALWSQFQVCLFPLHLAMPQRPFAANLNVVRCNRCVFKVPPPHNVSVLQLQYCINIMQTHTHKHTQTHTHTVSAMVLRGATPRPPSCMCICMCVCMHAFPGACRAGLIGCGKQNNLELQKQREEEKKKEEERERKRQEEELKRAKERQAEEVFFCVYAC